jgi:hypothetical protein
MCTCIYIYSHPKVNRIWYFHPRYAHNFVMVLKFPCSIYNRMTTYHHIVYSIVCNIYIYHIMYITYMSTMKKQHVLSFVSGYVMKKVFLIAKCCSKEQFCSFVVRKPCGWLISLPWKNLGHSRGWFPAI